jgi:hypothetical protein
MVTMMNWTKLLLALAVSVFLGGGWLFAKATAAVSLILTVNRTGDGSDLIPGDGLCDTSVNVGEQCSLRAAIEELNQQGIASSPHRIEFAIPGTGPFTISPASRLPFIEVPVQIDGTTQPGASCPTSDAPANLMIVLDGSNAGSGADGLYLQFGSDGSLIQGLVVENFSAAGIWITSPNNTVTCNQLVNNTYGIQAFGENNTIGGQLSPSQRNVISSNLYYGIVLEGSGQSILNNLIGTTADGIGAAGNNIAGIYVSGSNNVIGGPVLAARNLISGNGIGIWISSGDNNTILGNYIGVTIDGTDPLPNDYDGVRLSGYATTNQIGGTASGEENTIAYNRRNGVRLTEELGNFPVLNEVRGNSIHHNGELGIDLGGDGVTGNDPDDSDTGENELQNNPLLGSTQGSLVVTVHLDSQPNTTYMVDVYRSNRCDPSGYGEGQEYLESVQMNTDSSGQSSISLDLAGFLDPGDGVTATASDPDGNTSEFSNCVTVNPAPRLTMKVNWDGDLGDSKPGDSLCETSSGNLQCSLRAAIEELNAHSANVSMGQIEFDLPGSGPFIIQPGSALPQISVPMGIDGATQPGAICPNSDAPANLMVVLDGSNAGPNVSGLVLAAGSSGSIISGLVIGSFAQSGIQIDSDDNQISCNHIGVGQDGKTEIGNSLDGITVAGDYNVIGGGNTASRRNVISGNLATGVNITAGGYANSIMNNFIGTTANGLSAAGNKIGGISISGIDNYVYSASFASGLNLISGNFGFGIRILHGHENLILRNTIGLARDGLISLPNGGNGIEILGESIRNEIGGPVVLTAAKNSATFSNANLIANNGGHGVMLKGVDGMIPLRNLLFQNVIYNNTGLGIDLGDDGVDVNDLGDSDDGENERLNYPWLTAIASSQVVTATLESQANTQFSVDVYRNLVCDPAGNGEGQQYLNTWQVTTDVVGQATITLDLSGSISPGDSITATASDMDGNTSEFSNCVTVIPADKVYPIYLPLVHQE